LACHAINHLYLYKLLKKTSYELLTGNKSNVFYFRVFRSKCYVLHKRSKSSKFAPKVYEGFFLGYDSNSRAYRAFNMTASYVETTCDVVFHETNDSQNDQPLKPSPNDTTPPTHGLDQDNHKEEDEYHDQVLVESKDQGGDEDDGDKGEVPPHPRVCHNVQRDHPVDNILDDIKKGVITRSHVANFFEHYSFVSSFEPFKVEDALCDLNYVVTMQEELNNFKCNEVRSLVERPRQNVVDTKWVFHN
jgi:hypothetical protein